MSLTLPVIHPLSLSLTLARFSRTSRYSTFIETTAEAGEGEERKYSGGKEFLFARGLRALAFYSFPVSRSNKNSSG